MLFLPRYFYSQLKQDLKTLKKVSINTHWDRVFIQNWSFPTSNPANRLSQTLQANLDQQCARKAAYPSVVQTLTSGQITKMSNE